MRKLLATITTLAMVLSMSVPAFAVDTITSTEDGKNTATKTVTANYAQSYSVTIADTENGDVTADKTTAKEGEEVALTITPNENYELDALTVTYGDNQTATVVDNKFTMPAADVTVTATFKEKQVVVTNATITGVTISGVEQNGEGAYVINPTSTVTFKVSGTDFDKLSDTNKVSVNGTEEALTSENGWTIDTTNGTATKTYVGTTFADGLTLEYTNDGGTNWTTVDVTISYEIPEVISVDINWGDMAFTYSDDTSAWAADTEGGDKMTITNNGNVTIGASVSYTPADGYDYITGSFDPASANLDAAANQVFTLSLSGAPTGDLKDVVIGNVTVTITAMPGISTWDELNAALSTGGSYKLDSDVSIEEDPDANIEFRQPLVLDLNDNTLKSAEQLNIYSAVTVSGGTVEGHFSIKDGGTLTLNGGSYSKEVSTGCAVYVSAGSTLIINGAPEITGGLAPISWRDDGLIDLTGYTGQELVMYSGKGNNTISKIKVPAGYGVYDNNGNLLSDEDILKFGVFITVKPIV